jgi:hypothetical protein
MYTIHEVRTGAVMSFCIPPTDFPARLEAARYARKSAVEYQNSKLPHCRLLGLRWPKGPDSGRISPLETRQTAAERLPSLEHFVLEATICMKKQGLSQKNAKMAGSLCY